MDPIIGRLLLSYEWRPFFILFLLTLGVLYTLGWRRLRARSRYGSLTPVWKLVAYWGALITIAVALVSFIDRMSGFLFYMHMIQHLMLTMIAGPLLMLANPFPIILWGLPAPVRRATGRGINRIVHKRSPWRYLIRKATTPGVSYIIMLVLLWGWHEPRLYNLALTNTLVHDLEHISFLISSLIFWWHVTGAGPRLHPMMTRGARIGYLMAGIPSTFLLGLFLSFSNRVIYTFYETVSLGIDHPLFLDPLSDQILGGIIMWVPGNMMYILASLILASFWLQEEEERSRKAKFKWMEEQAAAQAAQGSD